ncbi:hypothetical protein GMOD_00006966 [Pyrenophora seminiperda CCB06]|uniref:Uncharacterized protein n=1 Tax=Pyrenophora seminiperda CCB06 TaxID=1302712 RepID=A0A3M7MC50_9PLEO|nr:hypothetical protein GMOD_00006966 [Pyrenophora seminiperda CCB06]
MQTPTPIKIPYNDTHSTATACTDRQKDAENESEYSRLKTTGQERDRRRPPKRTKDARDE